MVVTPAELLDCFWRCCFSCALLAAGSEDCSCCYDFFLRSPAPSPAVPIIFVSARLAPLALNADSCMATCPRATVSCCSPIFCAFPLLGVCFGFNASWYCLFANSSGCGRLRGSRPARQGSCSCCGPCCWKDSPDPRLQTFTGSPEATDRMT